MGGGGGGWGGVERRAANTASTLAQANKNICRMILLQLPLMTTFAIN